MKELTPYQRFQIEKYGSILDAGDADELENGFEKSEADIRRCNEQAELSLINDSN